MWRFQFNASKFCTLIDVKSELKQGQKCQLSVAN